MINGRLLRGSFGYHRVVRALARELRRTHSAADFWKGVRRKVSSDVGGATAILDLDNDEKEEENANVRAEKMTSDLQLIEGGVKAWASLVAVASLSGEYGRVSDEIAGEKRMQPSLLAIHGLEGTHVPLDEELESFARVILNVRSVHAW